ncbi:HesA/MoeB/ThiF family protein [Vibrio tritonius]|uniref:HesA/MoeB/ThiF family protein n=1 Tax=Vibrio tritonius TaxID=1435069 RepID=UPI00315DA89B
MSTLTDQQFLRYQKQICLDGWSEDIQAKLSERTVLIIGCGGLGNAVALYLAASGVGHLVLVDDDEVELSNLPRQVAYCFDDLGVSKVDALKEAIRQRNSDCQVRVVRRRMTYEQLMLEVTLADVVLDCSDNIATRHQVNRCCNRSEIPLISGAAAGWDGQFCAWDYQVDSSCYHCLYPDDTKVIADRCSSLGIVGPLVGIISCYQSLACLNYLANEHFGFLSSTLYCFNGLSGEWSSFQINRDPKCCVCGNLANGDVGDVGSVSLFDDEVSDGKASCFANKEIV